VSLAALALAAQASLVLHASVAPARAQQLVPITIGISVTNSSRAPVRLEFPTPDLFSVQVRDAHGDVIFDSRSGHKPIPVHRTMLFPVGRTNLAVFEWNGLSDARRAPEAPGRYVVHVEMDGVQTTLAADQPLVLEAPTPISSVLAAPPSLPVTIAGRPWREGAITYLGDDSASVALSGPLGIRPAGRFVVRGSVQPAGDRRTFLIDRFAPAAENAAPEATPTPLASATPASSSPNRSR
jgi:hypothetical protein